MAVAVALALVLALVAAELLPTPAAEAAGTGGESTKKGYLCGAWQEGTKTKRECGGSSCAASVIRDVTYCSARLADGRRSGFQLSKSLRSCNQPRRGGTPQGERTAARVIHSQAATNCTHRTVMHDGGTDGKAASRAPSRPCAPTHPQAKTATSFNPSRQQPHTHAPHQTQRTPVEPAWHTPRARHAVRTRGKVKPCFLASANPVGHSLWVGGPNNWHCKCSISTSVCPPKRGTPPVVVDVVVGVVGAGHCQARHSAQPPHRTTPLRVSG